jgi:holo-[acyl-carrier protein] synthase
VTLSVGIDLVEVDRVASVLRRHPERFLTRHFTRRERDQCGRDPMQLAARWAAKEAASKALGTGIGPVRWREMEIVCDATGAPHLNLTGAAEARAAAIGLTRWSVSMSHTRGHAAAVVAAIGPPAGEQTRAQTGT